MGRAAAVRARSKSLTDAHKTKVYNLHAKKLHNAVKAGSTPNPNPSTNFALRDALQAAKRDCVPLDVVQRAVKKASSGPGAQDRGVSYSEQMFEAVGVGGATMLIHVLTDNANRAIADVRNVVNKAAGANPAFKGSGRSAKMGESGSVSYLYEKRGRIAFSASSVGGNAVTEETAWEAAIEAGCEGELDFDTLDEEGGGMTHVIYTDVGHMYALAETLGNKLFPDRDKDERTAHLDKRLVWVSKSQVQCSEEDFEFNMALVEALEDIDDVVAVDHNMSN